MVISAFKTTFWRPGRRTDRVNLTVEDLMFQTGLDWLEIGSREYENECHSILDTTQYEATQIRKVCECVCVCVCLFV